MRTDFNVEEMNLIASFHEGTNADRKFIIKHLRQALQYTKDPDMESLIEQTIDKISSMIDSDFSEIDFILTLPDTE